MVSDGCLLRAYLRGKYARIIFFGAVTVLVTLGVWIQGGMYCLSEFVAVSAISNAREREREREKEKERERERERERANGVGGTVRIHRDMIQTRSLKFLPSTLNPKP